MEQRSPWHTFCKYKLNSGFLQGGVFTICTAMCGSGYKIVETPITGAHLVTGLCGNLATALIACCVVVCGIIFHGSCVRRFAYGLLPKTSPTIYSGFELPGLFSS